jgi:uncharacterized protein HemX
MGILSRFTVTPLLYAVGALLVIVLGMSVALKLEAGKVDSAQAAETAAVAQRDAANTQRDAWKLKATGAADANTAANSAIASLEGTLTRQQQACSANQQANALAISQARADAADADRTLKLFTRKFQTESRKPNCAQALSALEAACPALQDY